MTPVPPHTSYCCHQAGRPKVGLRHKCTLYDLQAVADFTTVLKLDPTNVNAYFNRGSAYDSLGEYEKAVADYTHALDLDSSSADPEQSTGKRHINTICAASYCPALTLLCC